MPLYGHEIQVDKVPLTSHLKWAIKLGKNFIGKEAIITEWGQNQGQKIVGFELQSKVIPRYGYQIKEGGLVTSGTYSPTLQKPIGMAFVAKNLAIPGQNINVVIRNKNYQAMIVQLPFYKRKKGGKNGS